MSKKPKPRIELDGRGVIVWGSSGIHRVSPVEKAWEELEPHEVALLAISVVEADDANEMTHAVFVLKDGKLFGYAAVDLKEYVDAVDRKLEEVADEG